MYVSHSAAAAVLAPSRPGRSRPDSRPAEGVASPASRATDASLGDILIAEDHADSLDALRTLLEALGYRVHVASNGREAVERALEIRPDVILMDMMMPEMDGFEATRTLRSSATFPRVPIIAVTAMEGVRDDVLAAGCSDWLGKPVRVPALLQKMEEWVSAGKAAH